MTKYPTTKTGNGPVRPSCCHTLRSLQRHPLSMLLWLFDTSSTRRYPLRPRFGGQGMKLLVRCA